MQETAYRQKIVRTTCGVIGVPLSFDDFEEQCVSTDFGIAQIHYKTVERYRFSTIKLIMDLDYAVDAGAKVLSWFKRYKKKEPNTWFCRYNVGTRPFHKIKTNCFKYLNKINRYL